MIDPKAPLSGFFAEFCESQTHLDSLLSKISTNQKSKIADKMGVFLRRPWTVAKHYGIDLADSPEEFWSQGFISMKKNPELHEVLDALWRSDHGVPNEGTIDDFPASLTTEWIQDWGIEVARGMARLLSQDPHTVVRLTREADAAQVLAEVATENGKPRAGYYSPRALIFKGYASVQRTESFKRGWYEIQDEGSQLMSAFALADADAAPALQAHPTIARAKFDVKALESALASVPAGTVIDACAGSGGKTLAISDFLRGQGRVYAYDVYDRKVQALRKRAERAGESNIQAVVLEGDASAALSKFAGSADRLLVDSPCSGWGVLRRNPDIKWSRKPRATGGSEPERPITYLQHQVVRDYLPLLKSGGVFTYGVCTVQKAETVDQVQWILNSFPELALRHSGFIGPHETDGFFMASFSKK
ncbi:MAG: class I SAM-dependent methyltransferase [Bdellovibrionales bacterium]|nr:class I SAM-dependent methyltransferase [Bdellovibrionales bacterium]